MWTATTTTMINNNNNNNNNNYYYYYYYYYYYSGDQHALMFIKQQPRLGTSGKVELFAAKLNFFFCQGDELNW